MERESIESLFEGYWSLLNQADWGGLLDYFAENCSFTNSAMDSVVNGKVQLKKVAESWPPVENVPDWHAIDGNRLIVSWKERPAGQEAATPYRGVSSFLLDDEGKISDYVGTFNMQEVIAAYSS